MTQFSEKWKPEKGEKRLETARKALLPGEDVWFLGACNNLRPMANEIAVTPLRVLALSGPDIKFQARHDEVASVCTNGKKETLEVTCNDGRSMLFKMVPRADHAALEHYISYGRATPPPQTLLDEFAAARSAEAEGLARVSAAAEGNWPHTRVKGKLSRKASEAILRQCHGAEQPWLILTSSGGAGTLVAFDDRLAIIKTGGMTSLMAGSLGGERAATFHFVDITGIEYNSGFVTGVLEVLTPSYSGGANKDFWRGSNRSRNADSNDPWTLSNCLPLPKSEYNAAIADVQELKARIGRVKQPTIQVPAPQPPASEGLADQLQKLAALRDSGVLSDEEFSSAKARLLSQ
ncbi:SHOCT domain-containing protein [Knoellia koreensis]|nr:SHOCT domain-containing protein [Knoellia sp. DB2414S]